jgi:hypothetical protein
MTPRIRTLLIMLACSALTACPQKTDGTAAVPPQEGEAAIEEAPVGEAETPPAKPPEPSKCDCTCESEGCRCAPLTWRTGCACYDQEMKDCACNCKGETIVPTTDITVESGTRLKDDERIPVPPKEAMTVKPPGSP